MNDRLKNLAERVKLILNEPHFAGLAIVVVSIDTIQEDETLTFGNMCAACAAEILIEHIEDNGIKHLDHNIKREVMN